MGRKNNGFFEKKKKGFTINKEINCYVEYKKKSLEKDNENYKGKKDKYQKQLNELNKRIKSVKDSLNTISSKFDRMKKKEIELRENLNKNESIMKDLYAKQERLGQYRSKTERNKDLKKQINEYKKEIVEQKKLCKDINTSNEQIDEKIQGFCRELKKLSKLQSSTEKMFEKKEKNREKYKKQ